MTDFQDLTLITDNLVQYLTGSYELAALFIIIIFILILLGRGINIKYATTFTLPLMGFFVVIGWFGEITNSQWIVNLGLIVVSIIYGIAVISIMD